MSILGLIIKSVRDLLLEVSQDTPQIYKPSMFSIPQPGKWSDRAKEALTFLIKHFCVH